MLAPVFDAAHLVLLMMLEQVALAEEVVAPILVTTHLANRGKQVQRLHVALLQP